MAEDHSGFQLLGNIEGKNTYKSENMSDPSNPQDYATKSYVDDFGDWPGMNLDGGAADTIFTDQDIDGGTA